VPIINEINIKGEGTVKRFYAMIVAIIGVAILAMGIIFVMQANTAKQTVADEISPIPLSGLNAQYDTIKTAQEQYMAAEGANVQVGKAAPSAGYNYTSAQRALLGLAKSNIGTSGFVMMSGIVDIILGLGLILTGTMLYMKPAA
jgi:ABC-type dipeptide/oligopeptide/nickel transport system permease component